MDGQRKDPDDREQRIREMAHRIWEDEGRPPGRDKRHWEMAESLVGEEKEQINPESPPKTGERPAQAVVTAADTKPGSAAAKPRARSSTATAPAKSSRTSKRE